MTPTKVLFQRKLVKTFEQMGWKRTSRPKFLPPRVRARHFYAKGDRYIIALDDIAGRFLYRRKGYIPFRIYNACYRVSAEFLPPDLDARAIALAYLATRRPIGYR